MQYEDFNIRILRKRDNGYDVSVDSPAGSANAHIELPGDIREAAARLNKLSGAFRGAEDTATREVDFESDDTRSPAEIGEALYKALFSGNVGRMYDRSYSSLSDPESGLRIKLHLNLEDPEVSKLAQVPWEYVYEKDTMEYLTLSRQTPIVRYIEVQRRPGIHPLEGRLRILVVMSSPKGVHPLDLTKERELIQNSWADETNVDVDFLENPTRERLLEKLVAREYHVLHYMGHGAHDPVTGAGALVLEDDDGEAVMLDAQTLGTWLRDAPSVRLAFLNACDTGRAGSDEPFAGVANRLVMAGLPAVVAMQFPISDAAAIDFARAFYPRIVAGFGVDEATAQGRKAILSGKTGSMEWGTPVLYMRAPDGQLFDTQAAPASAGAPAPAMQASTKSALGGAVGGSIATAVVAGGIAAAFFLWPRGANFAYLENPISVFVGDSTAVRFAPEGSDVTLDDLVGFDVSIDRADGVSGITVGDTAIVDSSWQAAVTGIDEGSFTVLSTVQSLSTDKPLQFSAKVNVTLDPQVRSEYDGLVAKVGDQGLDTDSLLGMFNDLDSAKLGASIGETLKTTKTNLENASAGRAQAFAAISSDDMMLGAKKTAFTDWAEQFAAARGFPIAQAQDDVTVEVVKQQAELLQRTTVDRFLLCTSSELCSGQTRFSSGASVHTHIGYAKVTTDAERFTVRYVQDGNVIKERRFPSNIDASATYTRDYSSVRGSGPVEARLYNGSGDWIATAEFTLR
ncbi:MAG: CHAT domain-containing protein [Gammaproteobacteria bacterium]